MDGTFETLTSIVGLVSRDVATAPITLTIELQDLTGDLTALLDRLDRLTLSTSQRYPYVIAVATSYEPPELFLPFDHGLAFGPQVANSVSQIQDMICETAREPWPLCPKHKEKKEILEVDYVDGEVAWLCPSDDLVVANLGDLNNRIEDQ